jgi:hypothetical protein
MSHQQPGLNPGRGETEPIHDIIQAPLQKKKQILAGYTLHPVSLLKI